MNMYEVTIQIDSGNLDVEIEFEDGYEPTDDEIHDYAVEVIEEQLGRSKLGCYQRRPMDRLY